MVIKPPGKSGRLERRNSKCKEQEHLSGELHSGGQSAKARGWQASHPKESCMKNKITEPEIESANGEGCFHTEDAKMDKPSEHLRRDHP